MDKERSGQRMKLGAFFHPTGNHVASWQHPDAQIDAGTRHSRRRHCHGNRVGSEWRVGYGVAMILLCYRRHRFPPEIIQHAIWLYLRFTLSYRDVEELLAERELEISYETVRRWVLKFGPSIARRLRRHRPRPSDRWHLDEMVVRIAGRRMYL